MYAVMIFNLFLSFVYGGTFGDLIPPFVLDSKNKIGYWEFNGMTIVQNDTIILSPPVQFTKGSMWTNLEFPDVDWSIQFELGISLGTGGGGFGIWFIDKYGADGQFYGGPSQFRGIAVIGTVQTISEATQIRFQLLQDHGTLVFHENQASDATIILDNETRRVTLHISFQSGYMHLKQMIGSGEFKQLAKILVKIDLSNNYLGITSQSTQFTSRFDLYSLNFSVAEKSRKGTSLENPSTGHFSPEFTLKLRNPKFKQTLIEMGRMEENPNDESNISLVMNMITELIDASYDTASFSELNNFIRENMVPYAQKWHKRTLKMIDDIRNARLVYTSVLNYSSQIIQSMNDDLNLATKKITKKIENFMDIINSEEFEPLSGSKTNLIVISLNASYSDISVLVLYACIAELLFVLLFFFTNRKEGMNYD